ncbi:YcaO-like family protein [Virgibacillus alimentarius]|uniref:YcaO-like family protein n=1 Tax=Virgibacillus alimentarius TaxID=698769 RepID=UPI00068C6414|nr:YcaO-like family protein [Virgibacillus alimentarius]
MKIKLTDKNIDDRMRHFDGKIAGLWKSPEKFYRLRSFPLPDFHFITSDYPEFEKFVYGQDIHFTYHLSGYGKLYNESRMSFLGESAERFAYASQYLGLQHLIIKKSFETLQKEVDAGDRVCPLDYVNLLYGENDINFIQPTDKISWVKMNALTEPGKHVYIPLQLMVSGTHFLKEDEKIAVANAVSTGTASHETFEQSLEAALIEIYQLDSYNLYWYGGLRCPDITDAWKELVAKIIGDASFYDYFDVNIIDITLDKPIPIAMCEIVSDLPYTPKYTVGIQGAYTLERAVYRSVMETLAIVEYNMNASWTHTETFQSVMDQKTFDNLDDNVLYYARKGKPENLAFRDSPLHASRLSINLKDLVKSLQAFSKYAAFLNITPPDFVGSQQVITRIIVPELLPLCIPSFPQVYHPRYNDIGGILNDLVHPLP